VFKPIPEDQPLDFTLELNPYRAALVEYARDHGAVSLTPLPELKQRELEKSREASKKGAKQKFSDPDSKEFRDEDERVAAFNRGDLSVGEDDLQRILSLSLPKKPVAIELITGQDREKHTFQGDKHDVDALSGTGVRMAGNLKPFGGKDDEEEGFTFSKPESASSKDKGNPFSKAGAAAPRPNPIAPPQKSSATKAAPAKKA
jgi:hypothetical protein